MHALPSQVLYISENWLSWRQFDLASLQCSPGKAMISLTIMSMISLLFKTQHLETMWQYFRKQMTWKKLMAWIDLKSVKWPWNCTVHTVHTSGLSLPVSQPRSAPAPSSIPGPAGGAAQNVGTSWGQLGRNGRNGGAICCWFCWFDAALRLEWKNEAVSNNQSL